MHGSLAVFQRFQVQLIFFGFLFVLAGTVSRTTNDTTTAWENRRIAQMMSRSLYQ